MHCEHIQASYGSPAAALSNFRTSATQSAENIRPLSPGSLNRSHRVDLDSPLLHCLSQRLAENLVNALTRYRTEALAIEFAEEPVEMVWGDMGAT